MDKLTEIRKRHGEATPGPYIFKLGHNEYGLYGANERILSFGGRFGFEEFRGQEPGMDDEAFLQHSWADVSYLLQLVETQTQRAETAIKANVLLAQGNADLISKNHLLHAQVETQAKALEWYADSKNYDELIDESRWLKWIGEKAREALTQV